MNTKQARAIIIVATVAVAVLLGIWLSSGSKEKPAPDPAATQESQPAQTEQTVADKAAEQAGALPTNATSESEETAEAAKTAVPRMDVAKAPQEQPASSENTMDSQTEDTTIRLSFIDDLAAYLVSGYQPPKSRKNPMGQGRLVISYKQVNMHYGLDPSLFGNPGGPANRLRSAILDYMFRPGALKALYNLYADAFIDQMAEQTQLAERSFATDDGSFAVGPLNGAQRSELFRLYAGKCTDAGLVFQVIGKDPALFANVEKYLLAVRNVNTAYERFWKRDLNENSQVELAGKEIKQAIVQREGLRAKVVQGIRDRHNLNKLSDEELLYLTQWAFRRSIRVKQPKESILTLSELLTDMGRRLTAQAPKLAEQSANIRS